MFNDGSAFVASNKKPIGSSTVKTSQVKSEENQLTRALETLEEQLLETREAEEEGASQKTAPTNNTKSSIHGAIQESAEREGVDESAAASTTMTTTSGNEETTEAPSTANAETSTAYDEMSTQLNKLNESFSLVRNQTVNGLTTAYARAGEDLSLIGIALSQTNAAKSLNALIKGEVDYDQEKEGEGMEISLDNRVGNSRTVAEI